MAEREANNNKGEAALIQQTLILIYWMLTPDENPTLQNLAFNRVRLHYHCS